MIKKYLKNIFLQIKAGRVSNEEELREVVDQASARGFVEESEREMIQSVFDLDETLGYFTQYSIFWDSLSNYLKMKNKKR